MLLRWIMAIVAVSALNSQQPEDPATVLQQTRERLLAELERMPRYSCMQTITRRYYLPEAEHASCATVLNDAMRTNKLKLAGWDRLRLEVAIISGEGAYSWAGTPQFHQFHSNAREQLSGRGPLGSGDFGLFLDSILHEATVNFQNEERIENRRLLRYAYDMPIDRSRYQIMTDKGSAATAYSGTLLVDPEAADIVKLTVKTAQLPASNPVCQVTSEIEYRRTQIHDKMVLIPHETSLIALERTGWMTNSRTEYSSCREFGSSAKLLLDAAPSGDATTAAPVVPQPSASPLPAGLHFRGRIITTIDSDTAAGGDPVEVVLQSPIRDKRKHELVPAGAHLHGRLLSFEQRSGTLDYFRVSMQFESLDLNGRTVPLRASPYLSVPYTRELGGIRAGSVTAEPSTSNVTAFLFREEHLRLHTFEWNWTTLPVSAYSDATDADSH